MRTPILTPPTINDLEEAFHASLATVETGETTEDTLTQDTPDTEIAELRRALAEANLRLRWMFDDAPVAIARFSLDDDRGRVLEANDVFCALADRTRAQLLTLDLVGLLSVGDQPAAAATISSLRSEPSTVRRFEARLRHPDGSDRWVRVVASTVSDSTDHPHAIAFAEDVSDRMRDQAALEHRALHDPLTDLANRSLLAEQLERSLADLARTGAALALFHVDVDHFKHINDRYGHDVGDEVLVEVGRRLAAAVRPSDTVARIGGDEFAILCTGLAAEFDAIRIADRILAKARMPISLAHGAPQFTLSLGIAFTNSPDHDPTALHRAADQAMYQAKDGGRDRFTVDSPSSRGAH